MTRIALLVALSFLSIAASAQLGGRTAFNLLNIDGSARVAANGGAFFAVKDGDINLTAANPSLLDSTVDQQLALSYVDYYAKTKMGYAGYAHTLRNRKVTVAANLQYINYANQTRLDALGNDIGEFNAGDYNLVLGIGYSVDSLWSVGANLKTVYSSLDTYYSMANALDLAVTYNKKSRNLTISAIARNMGYQWRTYVNGSRNALPFELMVGFSKRPKRAPFRFSLVAGNLQKWDLTYTNPNATVLVDPATGNVIDTGPSWKFGDKLMRHVIASTEILITENFHLRLSYNYLRRQELKLSDRPATAGFGLGLGFKVKRFHISYGRAIYHVSGPANHLTLSTSLKEWF